MLHMSRNRIRSRGGFTLIELLVVVSIIVLLISILIPSLAGAKRVARTVHCSSNLRGIAQTASSYAAEWNSAILGSARTSNSAVLTDPMAIDPGSDLKSGVTDDNTPGGIVQTVDWMPAVARMMGIQFDEGTSLESRMDRFHQFIGGKSPKNPNPTYPGLKLFRCLENNYMATGFGGNANPHPMMSYVQAMGFIYTNGPASGNVRAQVNVTYITLPPEYRPRLDRIGDPGTKVFLAEGARWYNCDSNAPFAPTTTLALKTTSPGGMSGDYGPWSGFTRAYSFKGNEQFDGRPAAMRHGRERRPGSPYKSMSMNVSFFDGHVETMDGLSASDPSLWVPSGTEIPYGESNQNKTPEVTNKYWSGSGSKVVAR